MSAPPYFEENRKEREKYRLRIYLTLCGIILSYQSWLMNLLTSLLFEGAPLQSSPNLQQAPALPAFPSFTEPVRNPGN